MVGIKCRHTEPCAECPWRKKAPAGWLGGNDPLVYADTVHAGVVPQCHMTDDNPVPSMCAGALATINNSCKLPMNKEVVMAMEKVGRRDDCFKFASDFYTHHTNGGEYQIPMVRALGMNKASGE